MGHARGHRGRRQICGGFDLPAREATKVAAEIESHNGLIVQSGDMYEFSHLSLQEYLCADYLVRVPDAKRLGDYLDRYPAPVAVAAALSPEPSDWLVRVVMKKATFREKRSVRAFVHRLGRERPGFASSIELGHAVLKLMFSIEDDDAAVFMPLAEIPQVTEAVRDAVGTYSRRPAPRGVSLSYAGPRQTGRPFTPGRGRIPRTLWDLMLPDLEPVPTAN